MNLLKTLHYELVFKRRVGVLAKHFSQLLPENATVLDVGCGDGNISFQILQLRPYISIQGIDILKREFTHIDVQLFDGKTIPFNDNRFDAVIFADVLHHMADPTILIKEAKRVATSLVLIKDHCQEGAIDRHILKVMDWIGNAQYGVVLPYNYWNRQQWITTFAHLGMCIDTWVDRVGLYPFPANLIFDRHLHFVGSLKI